MCSSDLLDQRTFLDLLQGEVDAPLLVDLDHAGLDVLLEGEDILSRFTPRLQRNDNRHLAHLSTIRKEKNRAAALSITISIVIC